MSHNTFGHLFRVTTWGESHGPALGCVVDGCPPRLALSEGDIQQWLDKRRPGQSRFTTQRQEPDAVRILSGVYEGLTTGTPISLMIENVDQRSKDYSNIAASYRPGHADYAYEAKYGIRDPRGVARLRVELANYFAAAVLMPYTAFLAEARASKYDFDHISTRFGVSFEQACQIFIAGYFIRILCGGYCFLGRLQHWYGNDQHFGILYHMPRNA